MEHYSLCLSLLMYRLKTLTVSPLYPGAGWPYEILGMTRSSLSLMVYTLLSVIQKRTNDPVVEDIYTPNLVKEAVKVFGADDPAHPSVAYLRSRVKDRYIGGKVQAVQAPTHFDYVALRCQLAFATSPCLGTHASPFFEIQTRRPSCELISKK
jgi:hypothetical protein